MAKKKDEFPVINFNTEQGIASFSSLSPQMQRSVLGLSEEASPGQLRREVLYRTGMRKKKGSYKGERSTEEIARKKAERHEKSVERREKNKIFLAQFGLAPKERGPKLTKEERKQKRSEKGASKRAQTKDLKNWIKKNEDFLKKKGFDPKKFGL